MTVKTNQPKCESHPKAGVDWGGGYLEGLQVVRDLGSTSYTGEKGTLVCCWEEHKLIIQLSWKRIRGYSKYTIQKSQLAMA